MMRKFLLTVCFAVLAVLFAGAQQRCASYEHLLDQVRENPNRGKSLQVLDERVSALIAARRNTSKGKPPGTGGGNGNGGGGGDDGSAPPSGPTLYIPVVVNVVYKTSAENISTAQIQSQIDVLNQDFRKTNAEINNGGTVWSGYKDLAADCNIQFCLVQVVRKQTTVTSFSTNDAVKRTSSGGQDPTNPTTMLNMWSCNISNGILGYAQFPGGSAATDGVVILYSAFGIRSAGATATNYDLGRTATHEVGHWLGLRHIWGDRRCGDDLVGDTPGHDAANYGCPSATHRSSCKGKPLEMWMNYMDYTYDRCMYMFSVGQSERANGYMVASRAPYASTSSCGSATSTELMVSTQLPAVKELEKLSVFPSPARDVVNLVIPAREPGVAEVAIINGNGAATLKKRVPVAVGNNNTSLNVTNLSNGIYIIRVNQKSGQQIQKLIVQH